MSGVLDHDQLHSAIRWTLDRLQEGLSQGASGTSIFAVREMELELPVEMHVGKLGRPGFRLVQVGEDANPATIGRLKLSVVPLPREQAEPWRRAAWFSPEPLDAVPALTDRAREVLTGSGLRNVGDLLRVAADASLRASLVDLLADEAPALPAWLDHAELLVLPGVSGPEAKALAAVDAGSLKALSTWEPLALTRALRKQEVAVDPEAVTSWIARARQNLDVHAPSGLRRWDVREIEGIDDGYADRLADAGILDLAGLASVNPEQDRVEGVSAERLERWREMASWLVQHPQLDGNDAQLLVEGLHLLPWDSGSEVPVEAVKAAKARVKLPAGYEPTRVLAVLAGGSAAERPSERG